MFVLRCERPRALAAGIALLTMTGCYSYAPYGYNQPGVPGYYSSPPPGVYSQPGIYSQPAPYNAAPGTLGPGTSAPPPGGYPSGGYPSNSGSPTYNNNQPFQPGAIDGGPGDTYQPPSGYSPTPAEPFGADPRRAPVENLAPPVRDLEPSPRPRSSEPFGSDPANFGTRPGDNRYTPPPRTTTPRRTLPDDEPFGSDTRVEPPQEFVEPVVSASRPLTRMMVGPELKTPGAIVPAGGTQDAGAARPLTRATLTVPAVQHSNPYAHDRDGFTWLRGTVDFDEEDGSWFIIYNLKPDQHDPYQGGLTLLGTTEQFGDLATGDLVQVEGVLDPSRVDPRKAPLFRIKKISTLASGSPTSSPALQ